MPGLTKVVEAPAPAGAAQVQTTMVGCALDLAVALLRPASAAQVLLLFPSTHLMDTLPYLNLPAQQ